MNVPIDKGEAKLLRELGFKRGKSGFDVNRHVRQADNVWVQKRKSEDGSTDWAGRRISSTYVGETYSAQTLAAMLALGELRDWA